MGKYNLLAVALILTTVATVAISFYATSDSTSSPYVYPIQPGTEAWAELADREAMLKASQIPPEVVASLSTNQLLDTVLRYPLYGDMLAYNTSQLGFDQMASSFNGLQALLERKDPAIEVLARYHQMDPLALDPTWSEEQKGDYDRQFVYIEALLAQPAVLANLSPDQQSHHLLHLHKTLQAKASLPDTYGFVGLESTLWVAGRLLQTSSSAIMPSVASEEFLQTGFSPDAVALNEVLAVLTATLPNSPALQLAALADVSPADYTTTVTTPRGSRVTVIKVTGELTAQQRSSNDAWVRRTYPRATLLRGSTRKYNCHSYAWHSQSAANDYWMNTPGDDKYWLDGSYSRLNYCPVNGRISYANGDHSGYLDSNGLSSKWGQYGLVRHGTTYNPYNSSVLNFYKRN